MAAGGYVAVRPDGYIGFLGDLGDEAALDAYLDGYARTRCEVRDPVVSS